MKVASIYNDYEHASFSLHNGVPLTSPTLLLDGGTSDVIDFLWKKNYSFVKTKLGYMWLLKKFEFIQRSILDWSNEYVS